MEPFCDAFAREFLMREKHVLNIKQVFVHTNADTIHWSMPKSLTNNTYGGMVTWVIFRASFRNLLVLHYVVQMVAGGRKVKVLLVGMNPGPYGMAQTGVPFGDSKIVQDFHGIFGNVGSPVPVHPKRPIYGFDCQRSEVSGQRLWGWAQHRFGSAAAFFKHFWVYNYCPLVFMVASGKNHTPDKLHAEERRNLETICNIALIKTVSILQPAFVVGIGKYAAKKVKECNIAGVISGEIMHPSPANPQANKEWSKKIESQLEQVGFVFPTL